MYYFYFKIVSDDDNEGELIAIFKYDDTFRDWDGARAQVSNELETEWWTSESINQVEFETYQAFGIKEIKL